MPTPNISLVCFLVSVALIVLENVRLMHLVTRETFSKEKQPCPLQLPPPGLSEPRQTSFLPSAPAPQPANSAAAGKRFANVAVADSASHSQPFSKAPRLPRVSPANVKEAAVEGDIKERVHERICNT